MKFRIIMILFFSIPVLISCSKDSGDAGGTPELPGYWKGNTTAPGSFTNPLNGLNFLIKTGGNIRVYYSTVQRPLNDTTASDVVKENGTYTVAGDDVTIVTARINCQGIKNAAFTNLQGTFKYSDFGIILTQSFVVKK